MVKEFIKRYQFISAGLAIYSFLVSCLVSLIGLWEKFSSDKIPDWLSKRGWTLMGAVAAWLGAALVLTVVLVFLLYLILRYGFPSFYLKTIQHKEPEPKTFDASKVSFELTGLNSEQYDDGVQYMLARFTYNTGVGPSPKIEVKANLEVWDDDSLRFKDYPGVWHGSKLRSKRFSSGDSADLVLGLVSDKGIVAYEYNILKTASGTKLDPKRTEINSKRFYIRVVFIARTDKDVLLEPRQWFGVEAGAEPKFAGLLKPPSHIW
jgi:hypothetical protein